MDREKSQTARKLYVGIQLKSTIKLARSLRFESGKSRTSTATSSCHQLERHKACCCLARASHAPQHDVRRKDIAHSFIEDKRDRSFTGYQCGGGKTSASGVRGWWRSELGRVEARRGENPTRDAPQFTLCLRTSLILRCSYLVGPTQRNDWLQDTNFCIVFEVELWLHRHRHQPPCQPTSKPSELDPC